MADGPGSRRTSSGSSRTEENSRASGGGPAPSLGGVNTVTANGTYCGLTDHPVWRNSPAFSIQLKDSRGRIATFVQMAMIQAPQ